MQWDNHPVYRRRRRAVAAIALALLLLVALGVRSCSTNLGQDGGPTGPAAQITIAFAGDVQAHAASERINTEGLGAISKQLSAADLALVNLETVVVEDARGLEPQPKQYTFVTSPTILGSLKKAGVDAVAAANNHTMDYGDEGMARMLAVKKSSPLPMVGLGKDEQEAWAPWTTEVKGRKVVVFSATDVLEEGLDWKAGPDKPGLAKVMDDDGFARLVDGVRAAREAGPDDVVVVYLHSGVELERCPTDRQKYTNRELARAGATIVVGSHAHILQTTGSEGDTAIAYGMGNFVFPAQSKQTTTTGVLTVTVPPKGRPEMGFEPAVIRNGMPEPLKGPLRDVALQEWQALGKDCS
ncbi:CapA family protein [Luteococcus sp.]|uniref:CapA family protein n=1 Tax=Luteococcus sp. TaxID=1969402 RepID=UPI0037350F02